MAGKIHGGTIQAELTADVSGYMSGLGQATQASQQFQRSVTGISFQGFNRGIIATTTLLYGMNRIMSQMSQGMEEFSNVLARIGSVADLTAESVRNLADSMKSVSVSQGVVRSDIMKAMYTTAQSRFTKPSEMRFFGEQSAMLSRASGKEIDAMGAAKLMTGLVRSLGLDVQKDVASGKLSDMLLKSRDIGRWELREMAPAIAKVATVFGNEFADRLGGIETLRQMNAIMAVASGTDLPLGMVSTGVRRLVERSYQLRGSGRGDYLRSQLAGLGYDPKDPITAALEKGPLFYLRDLAKLSGGSPMELYKLGFQSRELAAVSAAMSGKGSQLMSAYQRMAPGSISGLTGQYSDKMKNTYEFSRDQLRAQWKITSEEFMQASIPLIGSFTTALSGLNKVAQMLPDSVKSFMGLIAMLSSLRFALNLLGFKGSIFGISSKRMTGGGEKWVTGGAAGVAGSASKAANAAVKASAAAAQQYARPDAATVAASRLARSQTASANRAYTRYFDPHPLIYNPLARGYMAKDSRMRWTKGVIKNPSLLRMYERYHGKDLNMSWGEAQNLDYRRTPYGPTTRQRFMYAAYKRGESINFEQGSYGGLSDAQRAYRDRKTPQGSFSERELNARARTMADVKQQYPAMFGGMGKPSDIIGRSQTGVVDYFRSKLNETGALWADAIGRAASAVGRFAMSMGAAGLRMAAFMLAVDAFTKFMEGRKSPTDLELSGQEEIEGKKIYESEKFKQSTKGWWNFAWRGAGAAYEDWRSGKEDLAYEKVREQQYDQMKTPYGEKVRKIIVGRKVVESLPDDYKMSKQRMTKIFGEDVASKLDHAPSLMDLERALAETEKEYRKEYEKERKLYVGTRSQIDTRLKSDMTGERLQNFIHTDAFSKGLIADPDSKHALSSWESWGRYGAGSFVGYRDYTAQDVLDMTRRGKLSKEQIALAKKGGLDLYNISAIEPDFKKYMDEVVGYKVVGSLDAHVGSGTAIENLSQHMRNYFVHKLEKIDEELAKAAASAMSERERGGFGGELDRGIRGMIHAGRQLSIYNMADRIYDNGGNLQWGMEGGKYKKMFQSALEHGQKRFGGLSVLPASAMKMGHTLEELSAIQGPWQRDDPTPDDIRKLGIIHGEYSKEAGKMSKLQRLVSMMPHLSKMSEKDVGSLLTELTGRSADTDDYFGADVKNLKNLNISDFINVHQLRGPTKFESATSFGSSEAYNQLLQRDDSTERMTIIWEKAADALEKFTVTQEEVSKTEDKLFTEASTFFEKANQSNFLDNVLNSLDGSYERNDYGAT